MIISPKTMTTSSGDRAILTDALNLYIGSEITRKRKLSKPTTIDQAEWNIAYAQDLRAKINR